jgi:hypothetical protein
MSRPVTRPTNAATSAAVLPSGLVRIAVHALPRGVSRNRYRAEFLAELHGMPRGKQIRHASGVLAHVLSLRTAVTTEYLALDAEVTMNTTTRRPLMCRLNLHHHWRKATTDDGSRFLQCSSCGKDDHWVNGPMDGAGRGFA